MGTSFVIGSRLTYQALSDSLESPVFETFLWSCHFIGKFI